MTHLRVLQRLLELTPVELSLSLIECRRTDRCHRSLPFDPEIVAPDVAEAYRCTLYSNTLPEAKNESASTS